MVDELLTLKRKYPSFGPAKLVVLLAQRHGKHVLAASTAGELLSRHGLVKKHRSRHTAAGRIEHPPFQIGGAGHSMTADYKGQFRLRNGRLCYPLTIADPVSRYVFAIEAMAATDLLGARAAFERAFREYGIPWQLITDNGVPFCSSRSLGGLTRLSKWWIELGICPVRIQPGHPQQNGVHERMHRTLKEWILRVREPDLKNQQKSFDAFREEFNNVRPHQSLGQQPPATALKPYRSYASRPKGIAYEAKMLVRSVRSDGHIKWKNDLIYASDVLAGARIGLLEVEDATWAVYYGAVRIGYLDQLTNKIQNRVPDRLKPKATSSSV
jgi:transposase InsO family protein